MSKLPQGTPSPPDPLNISSRASGKGAGGGNKGDVSFIRATSRSSSSYSQMGSTEMNQSPLMNATKQSFIPTNTNTPDHPQNSSSSQHNPHQPLQPQQYYLPQHQYLPEHMDPHLYAQKMGHGAGGASGDFTRMPSHTGVEGWGEKEEMMAAELHEAKVRVAQMEKTMRWWSDCTSNWREKWNKARNERNKAREDNRTLRTKLEIAAKELSRLKKEKKAHVSEKKGEEKDKVSDTPGGKPESQANTECRKDLNKSSTSKSETEISDHKDELNVPVLAASHSSGSLSNDVLQKDLDFFKERNSLLEQDVEQANKKAVESSENFIIVQRKLDETNNSLQAERQDNFKNIKLIETLQQQLLELQSSAKQTEDMKLSLHSELEKATQQHKQEIAQLTTNYEDEASSRSSMDKRVADMQRELEKLQAENAIEWTKREQLESEKLALDRENKKMRLQIDDLTEEMEQKSQASSTLVETDLKSLKFELSTKQKELLELRHSYTKVKKACVEQGQELEHARRRAEQYEGEVRRLRLRVDELKHDLAAAEDTVDTQGSAARRSQRTNDELQAQVEALQVQVTHLQSRLRSSGSKDNMAAAAGHSSPGSRYGAQRELNLRNLSLEDSANLADSENDDDDDEP